MMGVPPRTYLIIVVVFCLSFGGRIIRSRWIEWRRRQGDERHR